MSVFIKQNHRFEDGAARHSEEGAGFAQSDVVFMQGMNEKFRLFFRAFKDARIAEQTICFEHSPERVFAAPDVPVPVAFPSEQRFGFCNVRGENVHRVAVGPEVAGRFLKRDQMFNSLADEFACFLIAGVFGAADGGDDPFSPEFALPDAVDAGGVVEF